MAYSFESIATQDPSSVAWFNNDAPLIAGINALESPQDVDWRQSGSFASGSDEADSSFPTARLYDRHTKRLSKPDSAQTTWYVIAQLNASVPDFDGILILNHNFGTIGGLTVSVEIADDNAFSSNLVEIASWSPSDDKRLADVELGHTGDSISDPVRYKDVPYLRVKIDGTSGTPQIGEILLIRRRQLKHNPRVRWDEHHQRSDRTVFRSKSGASQVVTRYTGQFVLEADFNPATTESKGVITDWWADIGRGEKPFVWMENPSTAPSDFYLMVPPAENQFPLVGPFERTWALRAEEQGPHFLSLES